MASTYWNTLCQGTFTNFLANWGFKPEPSLYDNWSMLYWTEPSRRVWYFSPLM